MNFKDNFDKYDFPKMGYIKVPHISISSEDQKRLNLKKDSSSDEYLLALTREGFSERLKSGFFPPDKIKEYKERLNLEYKEITRLLFSDYMLLIYKIVKFCGNNNILNGFGRGSSAGSLVLSSLGIIGVDPIKHGLLFERFISAARTEVKDIDGIKYLQSESLPDFDLDSDREFKYKINEFIETEYPNRSAAIKNLSTFQGKNCIKDVLKIYEEATEEESKYVSDMLEVEFGVVQEISDAKENNKQFKEWSAKHDVTIEIAQKISGLIKNSSVHASGLALCENDILETMPLELSSDKRIVTSYSMNDAQMLSIKIDNLGLKNLGIIRECLNLIGKKMSDIDVNDKSIYYFLNSSDCYYGIFQASEGLGKQVMMKLKCKNIEDVILSISVGRPGSLKFLNDILKAKETGIYKKWGDERIDNILKDTYSVIVYQESIMRLCREMAGFDPLETNQIRKIIGKKLTDKMPLWKEKFINGSLKNGFKQEICEEVWRTFEDSGNYLFNKSHANCYAYLSATTVYLKTKYPKEFFCAMLNGAKHEQDTQGEIQAITR